MRPNRSWWQVPLWSPMHLIATCVALLAILFLAGQLQGTPEADPVEPPASSTSSSTGSPTQSPKPASETSQPTPSSAIPKEPASAKETSRPTGAKAVTAVAVAESFVRAWSRRYDPADEWRDRVTALSTPRFGKLLDKTDPLRVPATRSTGGGKVLNKGKRSRRIQIGTDSGPVAVITVKSGGRWLVSSIQPVDRGR